MAVTAKIILLDDLSPHPTSGGAGAAAAAAEGASLAIAINNQRRRCLLRQSILCLLSSPLFLCLSSRPNLLAQSLPNLLFSDSSRGSGRLWRLRLAGSQALRECGTKRPPWLLCQRRSRTIIISLLLCVCPSLQQQTYLITTEQ